MDGNPYDPATRNRAGGVGSGGASDVGSDERSGMDPRVGIGGTCPDPMAETGAGRLARPKLAARDAGDLGIRIRRDNGPEAPIEDDSSKSRRSGAAVWLGSLNEEYPRRPSGGSKGGVPVSSGQDTDPMREDVSGRSITSG